MLSCTVLCKLPSFSLFCQVSVHFPSYQLLLRSLFQFDVGMSPRRPLCGVHIPPVILLLLLALLQTCTPLLPSPEIKSEIERAIKTFITDDLKNKQGLTNEKELRSLLYLTGEQLAFGGASKLASDKEKAYPTNKIQKGCGKLHPWMVLAGLSEGDFFRLQDWTPS